MAWRFDGENDYAYVADAMRALSLAVVMAPLGGWVVSRTSDTGTVCGLPVTHGVLVRVPELVPVMVHRPVRYPAAD